MENHHHKKGKIEVETYKSVSLLTNKERRMLKQLEGTEKISGVFTIILLIFCAVFFGVAILIICVRGVREGSDIAREFLWIGVTVATLLALLKREVGLYRIIKKLLQSNQSTSRSRNN